MRAQAINKSETAGTKRMRTNRRKRASAYEEEGGASALSLQQSAAGDEREEDDEHEDEVIENDHLDEEVDEDEENVEEADELRSLKRPRGGRGGGVIRSAQPDEGAGDVDGGVELVEAAMKELGKKGLPRKWLGIVRETLSSLFVSGSSLDSVDASISKDHERSVPLPTKAARPKKKEKKSQQALRSVKKSMGQPRVVATIEQIPGNVVSSGEMRAFLRTKQLQSMLQEATVEFEEVRRLVVEPLNDSERAGAVSLRAVDLRRLAEESRMAGNTIENLRDCLSDLVEAPVRSIEGLGVLRSWNRTATRACQISGLFDYIRQLGDGEDNRNQESRYHEVAGALDGSGAKVLSYSHARKYDRLGRFLLEFPNFLFQRKFVSFQDWMQVLEGDGGRRSLLEEIQTMTVVPMSLVFMRDHFQLHEHGFRVDCGELSNTITPQMVEFCRNLFNEESGDFETIFNNARLENHQQNDQRRCQINFDSMAASNDEGYLDFLLFKQELKEKLLQRFPRHKQDAMVVLMSREHCGAQLVHSDYSKGILKDVLATGDDNLIPLACLVALEDNTAFDVWPGGIKFDESIPRRHVQIILNKGDVLIFRGDLCHGGAATVSSNVRVHLYMDVGEINRPQYIDSEQTYYMYERPQILPRWKLEKGDE